MSQTVRNEVLQILHRSLVFRGLDVVLIVYLHHADIGLIVPVQATSRHGHRAGLPTDERSVGGPFHVESR